MDEIKRFYHAFDYKFNRNLRPTNDLEGQSWGLLFQKKVPALGYLSKSVLGELGGHLILDQSSTQIGHGESIEDTVKVLSRFLDGLIAEPMSTISLRSLLLILVFQSSTLSATSPSLSNLCRLHDSSKKDRKFKRSLQFVRQKNLPFGGYAVQYGKLLDSGRGSFGMKICSKDLKNSPRR